MHIHVYKWLEAKINLHLETDMHIKASKTLWHIQDSSQDPCPMPSALVTWHESSVSALVPYMVFFRFES